jgi:hypothetical protein
MWRVTEKYYSVITKKIFRIKNINLTKDCAENNLICMNVIRTDELLTMCTRQI